MMVMVNFATFVFRNSCGTFIATVIAAIEKSIHSRSAIHNKSGKENTQKYHNAFFHTNAKIYQHVVNKDIYVVKILKLLYWHINYFLRFTNFIFLNK